MGDRPRLRNKYERPKRLWEKDRIDEESKIKRKYGLKSMRELWRVKTSMLKKYRQMARKLLSADPETKEREGRVILNKLVRLGVMKPDAELEDILVLSVEDFLERRLQTLVYRKGLAKTIKQARQFVVHGHVLVDGRVVNRPSVIIDAETEGKISLVDPSLLSRIDRANEKNAQSSDATEAPEKSTNKAATASQ